MFRALIKLWSDYFFAKIWGVAVMAVILTAVGYGLLNSSNNNKLRLKAIHKNEPGREAATLIIDGKKGFIIIPTIGSTPGKKINIRTEETLFNTVINTITSPFFPVLTYHNKVILIDGTQLNFIHTGAFFICEQCHTCDLPRTWTVIDEESI